MKTTNKINDVIKEIGKTTKEVTSNRRKVEEIKKQLENNGITGGFLERVFNNHEILKEDNVDTRVVILIAEQYFVKTGLQNINPENWFTENEINNARRYYPLKEEEKPVFPFTFERAGMAGNNAYSVTIDVKTIAEWLDKNVLRYDYDIQRQAKLTVRKGEVFKSPTVNQKNVKEIEELILKGELVVTTLAFNADPLSSTANEELTYDGSKNTLTINEETDLYVLDGFHRCLGARNAFRKNPDVQFSFNVLIFNYTTREAQQYQAQLSKATPIPKARIQELEANRLADAVVAQLRVNSDLRGRISSSHTLTQTAGELVSYRVLSDAIDREFDIKTRHDTFEVSKYIGEFFDYLIGTNSNDFLENKDEESVKGNNRIFAGYVALASKMKDKNIPINKVNDILDQVDFNKTNPLWRDLGYLDENLHVRSKVRDEKIANYFRELV